MELGSQGSGQWGPGLADWQGGEGVDHEGKGHSGAL